MRSRWLSVVLLTAILLISSAVAVDTSSADGDQGDSGPQFQEGAADQIMSGIGVISDAVSVRTDNLILPSGAASVIVGVSDGNTGDPTTAAITGDVTYITDTEVDELYLQSGAIVTVYDGVTATIDKLFIESTTVTRIALHTQGNGKFVINTLYIEGLRMPLSGITVESANVQVHSSYEVNGQERTFALDVFYENSLSITVGGYTVTYTTDTSEHILMSVGVDLTDYTAHTTAPATLTTVDRMLRYIGSLDLVRVDVDIQVGGSYGIADYPSPFQVSDLRLTVNSHKDAETPYYGIGVEIGNVQTYPVDISGMTIGIEIPASAIKDGTRVTMDRSNKFTVEAASISVERVLPDDPLTVEVTDLNIDMKSGSEPSVSLSMAGMDYHETVADDTGTYDVSTGVNAFDMTFTGTSSDLLDNPGSLLKKIITSGIGVNGTITLGGTEYIRKNLNGQVNVERAIITGLNLKASLAIPQFNFHFDINSFSYKDLSRDISGSAIGYELWAGLDPSFDTEGTYGVKDILKRLGLRSVAEIDAGEGPDYGCTIDSGRAFITGLTTEGLRVICGDDTVTFDKASVSGLTSGGDAEMHYQRLTDEQIKEKVSDSVRKKLNGGAVVELSCTSGTVELDGEVSIAIKTDLNSDGAGAYRIDGNSMEKIDFDSGDGEMTVKTDSMGTYAVSGKLSEPEKVAIAAAVLISAMVLGAVTVIVYRLRAAKKI